MKQIPTIGGLSAAGQVALLIRAKERLDHRAEAAVLLSNGICWTNPWE